MKKNFKDTNPALSYISSPQNNLENKSILEPTPTKEITEHLHIDMQRYTEAYTKQQISRETKSRRLQILIRPGLYQAIARLAAERGISINETIHSLLESSLP